MIDAQVNDRTALAARSPSELAMYLRADRWETRRRSDISVQWVKVIDGDEYEVLQPLDSGLRDYAARVRDVLQVLAVSEGRSELDVLRDLSNVSMDVHSVRTHPPDNPPGMIGLDDGVQAYESLRNLVIAAAYSVSAEKPRAVQPARKPTELLRFIREVRIGPSTEGSFILSVHTPVPPRLGRGQASLFENDELEEAALLEPFERRVSLRIYDAVKAAHDAANAALTDPDGLGTFTSGVRRGISANLCEALVGLGGESGHPFELSLSLAAARPAGHRFHPVRFRRDHLPVLSAAAQELRERIADEDILVTGNVVRLHREGSGAGEISVAGVIEGEDRLRRIWMDLPDEGYQRAMHAHSAMLPVSVRGDLVRRGNRSYLTRPTAFQVLLEGDED